MPLPHAATTSPIDAAASSDTSTPAEAVAPLMRGVAVLHRLTEANGGLSLSALERATGLARSTVDRIVATLARMGYVRLDGRDAILTPRVMELGNAYLAALRLPALLDARADALADELDESVSLAVADRDGIRFIHQATRRRAMSLSFRIGDLLPAERTAPGPLFATEWTDEDWQTWRTRRTRDPENRDFPTVPPLPHHTPGDEPDDKDKAVDVDIDIDIDFVRRTAEAASAHHALDDQLIEPGLVAVSVPVRDPRTARIACVASVVSHTSRHTAADLRETLLPRLRAAVSAMEDDLRHAPPPHPGPPPAGLAIWTGASKQELGREFIESLARGLTVLTAFGEGRAELTLTEVAKATGLARATARRALITYEHLGLVTPTPHRAFALTPGVLALGFPPLSRTSLPRIATPHMAALAAQIQETTSLAILTERGDEIQFTAQVPASHVMSVDITVGTRLPASGTSMGRVLLPQHTDAPPSPAPSSYALVDEELEQGVRAIAVPIRDRTGRVVAALNAATHVARRTAESCVHDILPALMSTASRIETDLHTASRFTTVPLT
ncbi:IclR family transcriptional regulator domain-containing protein [Streptomyces sp. 3214.6]|uniref:IclR family transcriptional regulator domain-containing protein n=1 Tax=Streptomyces sp. 3214.6 TaxID=1882757 RepID=UPI00090C0570|nr:helix-turn-helix domain-containing protein [Streptomyces sp. 3214.6]SHI19403.1 transcriptional regulator, IclR family [Streptomyces sp. 3214.6]